MINFLKKYVDEETIMNFLGTHSKETVKLFAAYKSEVIKIIEHMKKINIHDETIKTILVDRPDVFIMEYEEFVNRLSKVNIPIFANDLNNDPIVVIEELFK